MAKTTSIGGRMRQRRAALGKSQAAIAEACGVNQKTISTWERGGPIPSEHVVTIADELGVTLEFLLRGGVAA